MSNPTPIDLSDAALQRLLALLQRETHPTSGELVTVALAREVLRLRAELEESRQLGIERGEAVDRASLEGT